MTHGPHPPFAITRRPEGAEDEPLLFELYAATRDAELAMTGWDANTRAAFLQMQFRAQRQGYRSMFPDAEFAIILINGEPAGRIVVHRAEDEIRVVDLALQAAFQGHGIGTRLLRELCAEAAERRKVVRLQALKESRAKGLYARLGFHQTSENGIYEQLEWRAKP